MGLSAMEKMERVMIHRGQGDQDGFGAPQARGKGVLGPQMME